MKQPTREEIRPEKDYFIFSTKWTNPHRTYDEFVKIWWKPNACGYTYDLNSAGRYSGEKILEHFDYYCGENTIPLLCEDVLAGKHGRVMTSIYN